MQNIVLDFCKIVLSTDRRDASSLEISNIEKDFIDNNYNVILQWENDNDISSFEYYDLYHTIVRKCCFDYVGDVISRKEQPYMFYDIKTFEKYIADLDAYCKMKFFDELPHCLHIILRWISYECEEFQNISVYINNRVSTNMKLKTTYFEKRLNNALKKEEEQFETLKKTQVTLKTEHNTIQNELKNSHKKNTETSVTILGIFSAIVLVANSGISISTDVLQNLITADISKAALIFSIFGVFLGNIVLGLISYLEHVRTGEETKSESYLEKVRTPVWCLNLVLGFVAVLLAISLFFGSVDKAEDMVTTTNESTEVYQISGDIVCKTD